MLTPVPICTSKVVPGGGCNWTSLQFHGKLTATSLQALRPSLSIY